MHGCAENISGATTAGLKSLPWKASILWKLLNFISVQEYHIYSVYKVHM